MTDAKLDSQVNDLMGAEKGSGVVVGLLVMMVATLCAGLLWGTNLLPGGVPGSLALVGLVLASGAIALVLVRAAAGAEDTRAFNRLFAEETAVCLLCRRDGTVIASSTGARTGGELRKLTDCGFARWMSAPEQELYNMARRAAAQGGAATVLRHLDTAYQLSVRALESGNLLWQLRAQESAGIGGGRVPMLRMSSDGTIIDASESARDLLPVGTRNLAEAVEDPLPEAFGSLRLRGDSNKRLIYFRVDGQDTCGTEQTVLLLPTGPTGALMEDIGQVTEAFLDTFPVALARLSADGTILYTNACARKLLGPGAMRGINLTTLLVGLGRSLPERLADTMKGRLQGKAEMAQSRHEDMDVYVQVSLIRHSHFGTPGILAVFNDATELKTLEAQFVQSQKMQAVGQLAGGVAHDFNNLLTAIHGHCDLLLLRHDAGDPDNGDLMQIRQNANRAAGLVRQLLAFSRKQTLRPKVLHLYDTLSDLTHLLNRLLGEKVMLRIENSEDLWPVRVDERQFEQVVMNLVVNARDAMPEGGVVAIRTANLELAEDMLRDRATIPQGRYISIEVEDSGVGIPHDRIAKIFEPFYTTKRMGEGTGLGLSTAYGIIKQTGGFIFADSEVGRGTTFHILLPAHELTEMEAEPTDPRIDDATRTRPKDLSGHGVVLLVEDEAPVRSFAARALQLRGYTVLEAASGEEALEILSDEALQVDLFVSDVIMPGLDGPSWVREAHKQRPGIGTVFVSGYAEDAFDQDKDDIPNASFLAKPFSLNALTETVKTQIGL